MKEDYKNEVKPHPAANPGKPDDKKQGNKLGYIMLFVIWVAILGVIAAIVLVGNNNAAPSVAMTLESVDAASSAVVSSRAVSKSPNTSKSKLVASSKKGESSKAASAGGKSYLLGKINPATDSGFEPVKENVNRDGLYLRKETYAAFLKMAAAAEYDGVKLTIVSAFRSYSEQKDIWQGKWQRYADISDKVARVKKIMLFSSMPGTSRHHWGTDIDLNSLENSYFTSGEGKKVYDWLQKNAAKYGFYLVYTAKPSTRQAGYEEEKWHYTYLPLSKAMYEDYIKSVTYDDITGFDGSTLAKNVRAIEDYVMGINPAIKK